eukprot:3922595-Amphidinium_carterae.1
MESASQMYDICFHSIFDASGATLSVGSRSMLCIGYSGVILLKGIFLLSCISGFLFVKIFKDAHACVSETPSSPTVSSVWHAASCFVGKHLHVLVPPDFAPDPQDEASRCVSMRILQKSDAAASKKEALNIIKISGICI